jgi:hypothetical protein
MNMPLNEFTFGNTKAAVVLAERLSTLNNRYVTAYITMMLSQSNETVKEIDKIHNSRTRAYLASLHAKDVAFRINNNVRLPERIATYANNVAQSKIKLLISGKQYEDLS